MVTYFYNTQQNSLLLIAREKNCFLNKNNCKNVFKFVLGNKKICLFILCTKILYKNVILNEFFNIAPHFVGYNKFWKYPTPCKF